MSIITKFIVSIFFEIFFAVYFGIFAILLVVQVFDKLDEFIKANASFKDIFIYFISLSPSLFIDIYPLVFIFSGLIFFLFISRSNELIALRTLGIRHQSIISVFILLAIFLSFTSIFFDFAVVPKANKKVSEVWYEKLNKKEKKGVLQGDLLFYKGDNQIWIAERISPNAKKINNLIIFNTDDNNTTTDVFSIKELSNIKGNAWKASDLFEIKIMSSNQESDGNFSSLTRYSEKNITIKEKPKDFIALRNPVSELGLKSLVSSILKSRDSGFINNEAETVFFNKLLFPFLSLTLCFALLPLIVPARKDAIVLTMAKGIIIATFAWAIWKFSINIGRSGKIFSLIPFLSIHLSLIFFGIFNYKKIRF